MRRAAPIAGAVMLACIGAVSSYPPSHRPPPQPPAIPVQPAPPLIGVWQPPAGLLQEPLWPGPAPDSAGTALPPEHSETGINPRRFAGLPVTGIYNVSVPTLTVFPPRQPGKHAAVLVYPGGGFMQLAIDLEGTEACDWLTARGITCILVKYRVPKSNHYLEDACDCGVTPPHLTALQDAQRALRLVRARAATLGIDPHRIGVLGFSAGGYLVAQTSTISDLAYAPVDALDTVSSVPDFAAALYPGHLCRDNGKLEPGIRVTGRTPPTFLLHAADDRTDPLCNTRLYAAALADAGVPHEVHVPASGGHAFGFRATGKAVDGWPRLLEAWLRRVGAI